MRFASIRINYNATLVLGAAVLAMALLFAALANSSPAAAQTGDTPTPIPEQPQDFGNQTISSSIGKPNPPAYSNMDSNLNRIVEQEESGQFTAYAAAANAPLHDAASVAVTLHIEEGYAEAIAVFLNDNGASPRNIGIDYIEAYIPVTLLPQASQQEGVISIRTITPPTTAQDKPVATPVVSDGVALHGAPSWHTAGFKGSGIKVGIIDLGFDGFESLMGTELPSTATARCYTDVGVTTSDIEDCENGEVHGSAVGEMAFDIAPEATYYISNPISTGDLRSAVDWMVAEDVDVINMSLAYTYSGPGDGTSPVSNSPLRSIDVAVKGGIVWVNSAGNYARHSYYGRFSDSDGNDVHDFTSEDECNTIRIEPDSGFLAQIRWDDAWGGASKDLDLILFDLPDDGTLTSDDIVAHSSDAQTGDDDDIPYEKLDYNPTEEGIYCLAVLLYGESEAPDWLQMQVWNSDSLLQYRTESRSLTDPADSGNPGMLAVGATHRSDTSTIASYSSQGPTTDGRTKPDVVGLAGGQTVSYRSSASTDGYFHGTSASAPLVAGIAALVKQRNPTYSPAKVASYLKHNAIARGDVPNNTWGHGFAKLPSIQVATPTPVPTPPPADNLSKVVELESLAETLEERIAALEGSAYSPPPSLGCVRELAADAVIHGSWTDQCASQSRAERFARYYTFTLAQESSVTIGLESTEANAYLYLLEGAGADGVALASDNNGGEGKNALLTQTLAPGSYTIEATTYKKEIIGPFTLTVSGIQTDANTNTGAVTFILPMQSDDDILSRVVELESLVESLQARVAALEGSASSPPPSLGCVQELTADAVITGSWTDQCASRSRAERYARYYTFTLAQEASVTIGLESIEANAYLYLLDGAGADGVALAGDNNSGGGKNALLTQTLAPGSYTIEATTYKKEIIGPFTLTVSGIQADANANTGDATLILPMQADDISSRISELETLMESLQERVAALEGSAFTPTPDITCVEELTADAVITGSWTDQCASRSRAERYARYYTFTLAQEASVTIGLESTEANAYLYLLEGAGTDGVALAGDNNGGGGKNALLTQTLAPGSYTIEATTYKKETTGAFTLTVSGIQ